MISFNRGHWCPFCKLELRTIVAYHAEIASHGGRVVSIVPDLQGFLGQLDADTEGKLLSSPMSTMAMRYRSALSYGSAIVSRS